MKRKVRIKVISLLLCVIMLTVQSGMLSVLAMEAKGGSITGKTMEINSFSPLPDSLSVGAYVYSEPAAEDTFSFEAETDIQTIVEGLEDNPKPLTMNDLISDFNISQPVMMSGFMLMGAMTAEKYPSTLIRGSDNENNAHTGKSDGDIDSCVGGVQSNYPIEISFTLDNLPVESAYIAIKALDVDEESGEKDYVFINDAPAGQGVAGQSIGALSGNNNQWNTTVLQIPLSKLKLGKNYVSITISRGWYVTVDWLQVILDGGEEDSNVSGFSISLDDAVQNGSSIDIASTIKIEQSGTTEYYTEYMLTNSEGDNLESYFGSASSMETAFLTMPLDSQTGTYNVTGLIKDKTTEAIKASDTITFDFVRGEVPSFGPKVSHSLSPSTLTNGDVNINITAENNRPEEIENVQIWYGSGDITGSTGGSITNAGQSVSENGSYTFEVKYTLRGTARTANYTASVSNIDKVGPVITAGNISVVEDTADAEVLTAIDNAVTVTDDVSLPANPYSLSQNSGFAADLEDKSITITARDTAGNESTKTITLAIVPKPVRLTQQEPVEGEEELTVSLSATLDNTGGIAVTESGFVWGVSQNPTYQVCNGKSSNTGALYKGSSINSVAEDITEGVTYYVRAYVKADDSYYYSDQKSFGIGAPQNGSFSVSADTGNIFSGGTAVFTISRESDQAEGEQIVHYRTVNGTAVGDTHFIHETGTLNFADHEQTKEVYVTVNGVSEQYGDYPATAYQNTERSFYFEIYKVEGGATIGTGRVRRGIAPDSLKIVDESAYNQYNNIGNAQDKSYTIKDSGFNSSGNLNAKDVVSFSKIGNTDTAYLDVTSDHYALQFDLTIQDAIEGYQNIEVTTNSSPYSFSHDDFGGIEGKPDVFYGVAFDSFYGEQGSGKYKLPEDSNVHTHRGILTDSNKAINIGKNKTVYIYYDASGENEDDWYKSKFYPYICAVDTKEPQLIEVAPMAEGTYSFGDEVYISLVFDEIIKYASGLTIDTNLSDNPFTYVEGIGTNVLVFKGTIDKEEQSLGSVTISSINNSNTIEDLAVYAGTPTSSTGDSADIDVNTYRPYISFTYSTADVLPRHNAVVEIDSAVSAKYAWTQSTAMPVSGWMGFSDPYGGTLTENLSDGTWHLHILAAHSNGNTRWEKKQFEFIQPTMNVAADNTHWARSRDISLTAGSAVPINILMSGAGTGAYTASQSINVTANGTYTFRLTDDYGSNIIKTVDVSRIDRTAPVISINEYGAAEVKYTSLDFGASAIEEEGGSGIASLQYAWTNSDALPESGWTEMSVAGGSIPAYNTAGIAYLHVKAVDNAGNSVHTCSQGYTVVDDTPPGITVTGAVLSEWQGADVTLNYTVAEGGAAIAYISAADTVMQDSSLPTDYPYNGSISLDKNGLYTFVVIDENGLSDSKSIVVNYIDKQAPVASFSYEAGITASSWARSKTIIVNASDDASPIVDANGIITGYGGSGTAAVEIKKGAEETYSAISNGGSFILNEDTTCYIRVFDEVGNNTVYTLPVSGIDTANPIFGITTPDSWQSTPYSAVITYWDAYSGIASAKYAVTNNNADIPAELSDMPESGGSIIVSGSGSRYIYYEVADNAGNTAYGWSGEIRIDTAIPELTVSANKGTAEGEAYTSGEWTREDVVFTLGNTAEQLSGISYKVSIDGGEFQDITGNSYTAAADTNAAYSFKAVSGSGIESGIIEYTVRIDKADPDINVSGNPSSWQNTDAVLDLSVSEPGISGQTVTVSKDGGEPEVVSGTTYTAAENGNYVFTVAAGTGETASHTVEVTYIDKLAPGTPIIPDAPEGWQDSGVTLAVSVSDAEASLQYGKSGISSFIWSTDGGINWSEPQAWDMSDSNQFTIDITGDYTDAILIKAEDKAGNISAESVPYTVKIDRAVPELTVSANKGTAGGEAYTNGEWTKEDVVFTLGNAAVQLSGISYKVSIDGGEFQDITGNSYTVAADTNAAYSFKAVSGSGIESGIFEYTVNRDNVRPEVMAASPANGSIGQSITPVISIIASEPLAKGDGYLTIHDMRKNVKVMDIHSSNNRVKLSEDKKTLMVMLPEMLTSNSEYYLLADKGFVTDRAGNKAEAFGGKDTWSFSTIANPVIPDNEIVVLGYTVELISKEGAGAAETSQILTAVTDKQEAKQHNIIAKAGYSENGTDFYLKLKVVPAMSAVPEMIDVSATEGTATLSVNKRYIDVLIPGDKSEATVTISLGNESDNRFSIKIINSSYRAVVETSGEIIVSAEESNLLNSVDLSEEIEAAKQPNTIVDVTLKMVIEKKAQSEIPEAEKILQAAPGAVLQFLDITIEKVVTTTVEGGSSATESEVVTATQQPVVIIIELPQELRGQYNYSIVREHNGAIDILPADLIDNGTRLRFKTDRFSTYSIAYTEKQSSIKEDDHRKRRHISTSDGTISSITAEGNPMAVEVSRLSIYNEAEGNINGLVPYYMEDNEENIVALSAVSDGQLLWIAGEGRTYLFRYNDRYFRDIEYHWAKNDILFASARELFNGTAAGMFSPESGMTRGMFVTVLGRLWGVGKSGPAASSFIDAAPEAWYAPYVEWAAAAGIVNGYGNGLFGPEDEITKEQMAVIINRFAKYTGLELNIKSQGILFADSDNISTWAVDSVNVIKEAGIINGDMNNLFGPKDTAARGEVAAVIKRFIENVLE